VGVEQKPDSVQARASTINFPYSRYCPTMEPPKQKLSVMSKQKWIILAALGVGLGLTGLALVLVLGLAFFAGNEAATTVGSGLSVYTTAQTASSHAGYRRSTLTCGDDVFVNDYEEAALQLANPEPSTVIGRIGAISNARVCAIAGQPVTAWIAGDCGSEMPAYVPFRQSKQAPFDWRTATFREMKAYGPNKSSPYLTSTDEVLLAEVVRVLRDGTPVELPSFSFAAVPSIPCLKMTSDELPGLLFCPLVCTDANGQIYLAESLMLDTTATPLQLHARWIPASPKLTQWLKGP